MKAIMISDKPKWCALMMNGDKTVEVRKESVGKAVQKLIDENGYADIYVYCSKLQNGKLNTLCKMKNGKYKIISNVDDVLKQIDGISKAKFTGKVVFKFRCYKVEEITPQMWTPKIEQEILEKSCLKEHELFDYVCSHDGTEDKPFYAIHISDLEIFDKPKEISEFNHWTDKKIQWYSVGKKVKVMVSLTNAPQNYCYVEIGKNE